MSVCVRIYITENAAVCETGWIVRDMFNVCGGGWDRKVDREAEGRNVILEECILLVFLSFRCV